MSEWQVLQGDCRDVLRTLEPESVQCVVTSPPYLGLRSYNGGDAEIGLESSPDEYVAAMVNVFREVRRVLHPSGVAFLNLGDSYAGSWGNQGRSTERGGQRPVHGPMLQNLEPYPVKASNTGRIPDGSGLKPKDLMGIPWRVAFALQADGWWLRSDIIFAKKAPMPESVTDRPTRSHEYVFLLTKSAQYYYDADAIREPNAEASSGWARQRVNGTNTQVYSGAKWSDDRNDADKPQRYNDSGATGRNKRDVWLLGPEPLSDAHFAVMPTKLVEPCILAGSAPGDTVLDPFAGSGTVLVVAKRLNRAAIGIELNETYVSLIHKRLDAVTLPLPLHTAQEQTA